MKQSIFKLSVFFLVMASFIACSDDDPDPIIDDDPVGETPNPDDPEDPENPDTVEFVDMESDWVRLSLLRDGGIDVMQADTGEIKYSVESELAEGARYYTSGSGQYLVEVDRIGGKVRFFDSGIVNHDDHGHENPARWVNAELTSVLPTHYTYSGFHMLIFNDGDGSISYIDETRLEIPSYQPETFQLEGTKNHHGVGIRLDSGKFAVTFQSETVSGEERLPQMVKFVDSDGTVIDDNGDVEVGRIHGSANNGSYGAFGSTDGVIIVDDQDNIDLIPNAEGLNSESGNWLGNLKGHEHADVFFGRSRNLGVFMVDPENKSITPVYSGGDVIGDMFSFDGEYYLVHTEGGRIQVFDGHDGDAITDRIVEMADIPELSAKGGSEMDILKDGEDPSPVLVASDDFLYVLAPNRTQIKVLEIDELKHVHTIELDSPVYSMMKNGFSIEGEQHGDHDH